MELWTSTLQGSYILFFFLSRFLLVAFIGILFSSLYKRHRELFEFNGRSQMLDVWIEFLRPYVRKLRLQNYRQHLRLTLTRSLSRPDWTPDHFIGLQLIYGAGGFLFALLFFTVLLRMSIVIPFVLTGVFALLPLVRIQAKADARVGSIRRDLSFFLDYLSLCINAGLDFNRALDVVVANAPDSALRQEFELMINNIKLGMTRSDALTELQNRVEIPIVKSFVQTLIQAISLGTNIADTLSQISTSINERRFQMAEEQAGKLSVRMMIPLMVFVMPSVMIVLLGPMLLTFLNVGL